MRTSPLQTHVHLQIYAWSRKMKKCEKNTKFVKKKSHGTQKWPKWQILVCKVALLCIDELHIRNKGYLQRIWRCLFFWHTFRLLWAHGENQKTIKNHDFQVQNKPKMCFCNTPRLTQHNWSTGRHYIVFVEQWGRICQLLVQFS